MTAALRAAAWGATLATACAALAGCGKRTPDVPARTASATSAEASAAVMSAAPPSAPAAPRAPGPELVPRTFASPADAPLWRGPVIDAVGLSAGAVALDAVRCELRGIDLLTGNAIGEAHALPRHAPGYDRCRHRPIAGAWLLREPAADVVVDPWSGVRHVEVTSAHPDLELVWSEAPGLALALERDARHMEAMPAQRLRAYGTDDWRLRFTVTLAPDERTTGRAIADGEHLYVKVEHDGGTKSALVAYRLADGAAAWRARAGSLVEARVGPLGVAETTGSDIVLLAAANGSEHWRHALGHDESPIDVAVGEGHVFVVIVAAAGHHELLALDGTSGAERWRVRTAFSVDVPPVRPHALLPVRERVFVLSVRGDDASELTGYEAATGRVTLAWGLPPSATLLGLASGGEMLVASAWPSGSVAFDPARTLSAHERTLAGRIQHGATSIAGGRALDGISVCSPNGCTLTDAQGGFALKLRGRGLAPVWSDASAWLQRVKGTLPPPTMPRTYLCTSEARAAIDMEEGSAAPAPFTGVLAVAHCPAHE